MKAGNGQGPFNSLRYRQQKSYDETDYFLANENP
jgi:hypothetical protein